MLVTGMISLTIAAGADALLCLEGKRPFRWALTSTFALAAIGVLAKGLIGIVLPGGVLVFWLIWRRSWRFLWVPIWPIGLLIFFSIALPWFLWMQYLYPGFFDYFVIYHHFQRFAENGFNGQKPFWFYLPVLLLGILPWSLWLGRVFNKTYWKDVEQGPLRSLMAIWLLFILVFFSLPSSKLIGYILPVLPPLAYFVADMVSGWLENNKRQARRWYAITIVVAMSVCLALVSGIAASDSHTAKTLASTAMRTFEKDDQLVILGKYQYDLGFYLRAVKSAWVVDFWSDPSIQKQDNWRKELFDAAKFDPVTAESTLLSAAQFAEKFCNYRSGTVWVWAEIGNLEIAPWLKDVPRFVNDKEHDVWRFSRDEIIAVPICQNAVIDHRMHE